MKETSKPIVLTLTKDHIKGAGLTMAHGIGDECQITANAKITRMSQHAHHEGDWDHAVDLELSNVAVAPKEDKRDISSLGMGDYAKRRNADLKSR